MDCASSLQVVVLDLHLVIQLLPAVNEPDLVNHDSLLLLESLLYHQDGVLGVEVERLLSAGQGLRKMVKTGKETRKSYLNQKLHFQ